MQDRHATARLGLPALLVLALVGCGQTPSAERPRSTVAAAQKSPTLPSNEESSHLASDAVDPPETTADSDLRDVRRFLDRHCIRCHGSEKQEAALSRLLAESSDNEAIVVRTIDRVEAARSALAKTRTLMLYRMHRLLSPEQRRKLGAYEQAKTAESPAGQSRPRE